MFRHQGKRRTFIHNLRLASNLSFVAGIVNIVGVLNLATLTTNVTGHFAFFAEEILKKDYLKAISYLLFILFFLIGAFVSNLIVEISLRKKIKLAHAIPLFFEIAILCFIGLSQYWFVIDENQYYIAYVLLFAMGLQNALVTQISQSTVRTTHLTGLFTDLGIELSQLFFYKKTTVYKQLTRNIYLRLSIIIFFFLGCVIGGFLYTILKLEALLFAAFALFIALFYDNIRFYYYNSRRKITRPKKLII